MTREELIRTTVTALGMHSLAPDKAGSGLGWTAKNEYIVYKAGIVATADTGVRTPYNKLFDGYAIGVYPINGTTPGYGNNWVGIYILSTDQNAAGMEIHTERGWYTCPLYSVEYIGMTWYFSAFNQNSTWSGANRLNTDLPVFDATGLIIGYSGWGTPPPGSTAIKMLEAAGVRPVPKRLDRPVLTAGR